MNENFLSKQHLEIRTTLFISSCILVISTKNPDAVSKISEENYAKFSEVFVLLHFFL